MKIALVILHADPARGGAERYTSDLAQALAGEGHDVALLASSFADLPSSVRSVKLAATGATRLRSYLHFLDSLDTHLNGESYDIVHAMLPVRRCDVYHPHAGIAQESVAEGHLQYTGIQRSLTQIGNRLNAKRQRFAAVERALLSGPRPPVVLCLSEYVRRSLLRYYPLPADRTATLFNAVDLTRFDPDRNGPKPEHPSQITALMVAQDFQRKGLRTAILAVARVPEIRLVVVGKDKAAPYQALAQQAGAGDRVEFIGSTHDTWPFYRAADLFVLPTKHDPCSLVVLEALAMGVPVISTRSNGACEIMTDGVHGFVLDDPDDIGALARAMSAMLDSPRRAAMSRACAEVRTRLSYRHHLEKLTDVYRGIVGQVGGN